MLNPSDSQYEAAERRVQAIKVEIAALLKSETAVDERIARWTELLSESLVLQEMLERAEKSASSG